MKYLQILFILIAPYFANAQKPKGYKMVWKDEFKGKTVNTKYWTKIPRGRSDWNRNMSPADELYAMRKGKLILRGIVNTTDPGDTAQYLTGGIYSKSKKTFGFGRLDVKAKLGSAIGAWPAIWMLPEGKPWPNGGEIDIMERLNYDSFAYQTIHTPYTQRLKIKVPPNSATGKIDTSGFNIYSVEMFADSLLFYINNTRTFSYPRIHTDKEGQFPFSENEFYLLLDMQLGGSWVGKVDKEDLPVEMEIDYVRYYQPKHRVSAKAKRAAPMQYNP